MVFNQRDTLNLNDPLVQVMLCGDENGNIPEVGKIPAEFRGGRTKGEALRDAVGILNYKKRYAHEISSLKAKILQNRKGVPSEVNVTLEQQLVGAAA